MKLFSNLLDKVIPSRKKEREHKEKLLKEYNEGKYLRVDTNDDNKEIIKHGRK